MTKTQETLSEFDPNEAASGDARTVKDVLADTASPILTLFWDGDRGQRVLEDYTNDDISIGVAQTGHLWIRSIKSKNVTIFCSGAAHLKIANLSCDQLTIYVGYSSRVELENVNVQVACNIDVHYSSTLLLDAGFIKSIAGSISYSSTGCHRGGLTIDRDTVTTSHAGAWTSFCL